MCRHLDPDPVAGAEEVGGVHLGDLLDGISAAHPEIDGLAGEFAQSAHGAQSVLGEHIVGGAASGIQIEK